MTAPEKAREEIAPTMAGQPITSETSMSELAAIVSEALSAVGIVATLSGGGAVSIHTENRYESEDLDIVTTALLEDLKVVLEPLGFAHTGIPRLSVFEHPETRWYLEFPPAPLRFGGTYVDASQCAVHSTPVGDIRFITTTHSVMDRLIAAATWMTYVVGRSGGVTSETHADGQADDPELVLFGDVVVDVRRDAVLARLADRKIPACTDPPHKLPVSCRAHPLRQRRHPEL